MTLFNNLGFVLTEVLGPGESVSMEVGEAFGESYSLYLVKTTLTDLEQESYRQYANKQYYQVGYVYPLVNGFAMPPTWLTLEQQFIGIYYANDTNIEPSFLYPDVLSKNEPVSDSDTSKLNLGSDGEPLWDYIISTQSLAYIGARNEDSGVPLGDIEGITYARSVLKQKTRLWASATPADAIFAENISRAATVSITVQAVR